MLKLSSPSAAPEWIDLLPGVRLQVRMVDSRAIVAARAAARRVYVNAEKAGRRVEDLDVMSEATVALTVSIAQAVIAEWEGVADSEGEPVTVTPENIDALMAVHPAYAAFDALVVAKGFGESATQL